MAQLEHIKRGLLEVLNMLMVALQDELANPLTRDQERSIQLRRRMGELLDLIDKIEKGSEL